MAPLSPVESDLDQPVAETPAGPGGDFARAAYGWLRTRHFHISVCLAVTLALLNGSVSLRQQEALNPSKRIVAMIGADLGPRGFDALTATMDRYGIGLARVSYPGAAPWLPPRPLGWDRYDFEHVPGIIGETPDQDHARELNALLPVSPLPNPPMKAFKLAAAGAERERALLCLSQAVYYEAGFESGEGQQAVAQVVLNRLRHPAYPKSVCGVVYQGASRVTGCQFSFTCDGSLRRPLSAVAFARAKDVAAMALNGFVYKPVGASTHYHADYVFPYWSVTLVKLRQIGAHIFYRMTGPGGAPEAFNGRYAGGELNLPADVLTGGDARTPDAPAAVTAPEPVVHTITLQTGGETRTYTVAGPAASGTYGLRPAPGGVTAAPGLSTVLSPTRRQPTPDEIKVINEKMLRFEEDQKRPPAPVAVPAAPAP